MGTPNRWQAREKAGGGGDGLAFDWLNRWLKFSK